MTQTLALTAPDLIRRVARLISDHGWGSGAGAGITPRPGVSGLDLAAAARWAVHGSPCRSRDLSDIEAVHVAEVLDHIEAGLEMPVAEYERRHVDAAPRTISIELLAIAWVVATELEPTDPRRHDW